MPTETNNWEIEFEKEFYNYNETDLDRDQFKLVKSFISQKLQAAKQEERNRIVKLLRMEKKEQRLPCPGIPTNMDRTLFAEARGYNLAVNELNTKLDELGRGE